MRRYAIPLAVGLLCAIARTPAVAEKPFSSHASGGGTRSFNADLDGDGDIDGSHFGLDALLKPNGSAQGHFLCLMAGDTDFLGLNLMAVEGRLNAGQVNADGTVSLSGVGTVNLGEMGLFRGASRSP